MGTQRMWENGLIFVLLLAFAYGGQSLLKAGLRQVGEFTFDSAAVMLVFFLNCARSWQVVLGSLLVATGFGIWVTFLSRMDLSQALPMLAFSYVPWLLIGAFFFGEQITLLRLMGVILITAGVICVSYSPRGPG